MKTHFWPPGWHFFERHHILMHTNATITTNSSENVSSRKNWMQRMLYEIKKRRIRCKIRCISIDGCSVGGVALLHSGHNTVLNCNHGLSLMSRSLIFVFVLGLRKKQFLCCMYLVKIVWSYRETLIADFWVSTDYWPH
jgi:hypothetical protein